MTHSDQDPQLKRFVKQTRFHPVGLEGQAKLRNAKIAVVGVGALGSTIAERLVRAGIGSLRIIDRDWVELDNLPRQALYTEADANASSPKAAAAEKHLRAIDSTCKMEACVEDLTVRSIDRLLGDVDLIMDGTDNFETRFLINDFAHEHSRPWIHGGCLGASGQVMTIVPGQTACLRCILGESMSPGTMPTCDTAGVLGPAVSIIAAWQCVEAIKYLCGGFDADKSCLLSFDIWSGDVRKISMKRLRETGCPSCRGERMYLRLEQGAISTVLCGRDSVQVQPNSEVSLDLPSIAIRFESLGPTEANPFFVRTKIDSWTITLFRDGRAVIGGTSDPAVARSLYARWVGC